jgi:N-methylhydantoinase A
MKYPLQSHQVEVDVDESDLDSSTMDRLVARFTARYEQLYGRGSSWEGAGVELVGCRVVARGTLLAPQSRSGAESGAGDGSANRRSVVWATEIGHEQLDTRVMSANSLPPGTPIEGPAVIEADTTTVVIPPGCSAAVTEAGDLTISLAPDRAVLTSASAYA